MSEPLRSAKSDTGLASVPASSPAKSSKDDPGLVIEHWGEEIAAQIVQKAAQAQPSEPLTNETVVKLAEIGRQSTGDVLAHNGKIVDRLTLVSVVAIAAAACVIGMFLWAAKAEIAMQVVALIATGVTAWFGGSGHQKGKNAERE